LSALLQHGARLIISDMVAAVSSCDQVFLFCICSCKFVNCITSCYKMEKEINDVRAVQPMVCGLHLYVRTLQLRVCGVHVCSYQGCPTCGTQGSISVACDSILPYLAQILLILPSHLELSVNLVALFLH
jgi:hypothetical protein